MTELAKVNQKMSSRTMAMLTGKRHDNVLRDIRNLEPAYIQEFGDALKFEVINYIDERNRRKIEYLLTKSQSLFIVSGYNPVLRAKIQRRWEELEMEKASGKVMLPSRKEMALMILQAEEELERANETIALQAPKVDFVDEVFEAPTLLSMGEAAKMLGIGRNTLFSKLRMRRVLMSGIRQNEPYQTFVDRGYFEVKGAKVGSRSAVKVVPQTYVTTRGLAWIRLNIMNQ